MAAGIVPTNAAPWANTDKFYIHMAGAFINSPVAGAPAD